jgi:hypothetical protein
MQLVARTVTLMSINNSLLIRVTGGTAIDSDEVRQSSARHEPEKQGLFGNRFYFCFHGSHLGLT